MSCSVAIPELRRREAAPLAERVVHSWGKPKPPMCKMSSMTGGVRHVHILGSQTWANHCSGVEWGEPT